MNLKRQDEIDFLQVVDLIFLLSWMSKGCTNEARPKAEASRPITTDKGAVGIHSPYNIISEIQPNQRCL